ncbi:hypothetical protein CCM_08150 [Cordyceps militaris CM01]|uniref:Uncharacterized protein n=1 Tax=Cordyceps militaris (strain CM01) TaxID=983644 RepID=G3JNQ7_CORMM|nr:uncharacterized protein CCM_08150 [Cordyceps militaris CM01]EGX89897.1 hypothetical protein CCM_08150 [Cordyceps militaris CM01]
MAQQRPAPGHAQTALPPFSFPSPNLMPANQHSFNDAVAHAKATMRSFDPAVLRQAVRELWELTLVGSEYHSSFLCSTLFHRAPPAILSRTIEQHGARLVRNSAGPLARHLRREDLDMMAPSLMSKLSNTFLDKALALRLESIGAQPLVNALGRAERLGYDTRDVVTDGGVGGSQSGSRGPAARQERVIPTANPIPPPSPSMLPAQQQQPAPTGNTLRLPSAADLARLGIAHCDSCNRPCGGIKALLSHRRSGLCGTAPVPLHKLGKEYCLFCGQRFLGQGGLAYHRSNNVCGIYMDEHAQVLIALLADAERILNSRQPPPPPPPPQVKAATTPKPGPAASSQSMTPQRAAESKDPYAKLTPTLRLALDVALTRVEHQYAEGIEKAKQLHPDAQKAEMARLKNLYNNKQSMTRKKFGIRLRERRSKSEIDEERSRMLSTDPQTPVTPGYRTHSEATGTPRSMGSASRQGTPKTVLLTEMGNRERTASASTAVVAPAPESAGTGARPPPLPMSIAGSHTAPVRAPPEAATSKAIDPEPIEIDDDEYEEVDVEESVDEDANAEKSPTGMDIDEAEQSPNQDH